MNHILDGIKTEAGKRLWTKINDNYGSSIWGPVGDGIVEIEAEVEARIIKLLESEAPKTGWLAKWESNLGIYGNVANYLIARIKEGK